MKYQLVPKALFISLLFLMASCGQGGFSDSSQGSNPTPNTSTGIPDGTTPGKVNPKGLSVFTGEQLMRSWLSVTGVTLTDKERENLQSGLVSLPIVRDLSAITAPMWMSLTTSVSIVCKALVTAESAPKGTKVFFTDIDFTKGVSQVTETNFNSLVNRFSRNFWGRAPTDAELKILNTSMMVDYKTDVENPTSPVELKTFLTSLCSLMLSNFETITY